MSKVRVWAEDQRKVNQKGEPIKILSDAIIYGLSKFCSSEKGSKGKENFTNKTREKVFIKYCGDASLFEVGCYLYFRIDLWHYRNKMQKYHEEVVNYLIDQFLLVFKNSLHLENIEEVLQNRLDLYGRLIRESKNPQNEIHFYLTQLVSLTRGNLLPEIYDFKDFPVLIIDAFENVFLENEIRAFEQAMVPACLKSIENFYKLTSEDRK